MSCNEIRRQAKGKRYLSFHAFFNIFKMHFAIFPFLFLNRSFNQTDWCVHTRAHIHTYAPYLNVLLRNLCSCVGRASKMCVYDVWLCISDYTCCAVVCVDQCECSLSLTHAYVFVLYFLSKLKFIRSSSLELNWVCAVFHGFLINSIVCYVIWKTIRVLCESDCEYLLQILLK